MIATSSLLGQAGLGSIYDPFNDEYRHDALRQQQAMSTAHRMYGEECYRMAMMRGERPPEPVKAPKPRTKVTICKTIQEELQGEVDGWLEDVKL